MRYLDQQIEAVKEDIKALKGCKTRLIVAHIAMLDAYRLKRRRAREKEQRRAGGMS
jgi:hypothetical protein